MNIIEYAERLKKKDFNRDKYPHPRDGVQITIPKELKNLDLEIGCGAGLHPILYGKKFPSRHLVACERTLEKFQLFEGRLKRHELKNITPLHTDALTWLNSYLPKNELEKDLLFNKIFILYPNPYPKQTQRNKRLFAMPAFSLVLKALQSKGKIILRTNEESYLQEAIFLAKKVWDLRPSKASLIEEENGVTHFERKYLSRGEKCWEVTFKKN